MDRSLSSGSSCFTEAFYNSFFNLQLEVVGLHSDYNAIREDVKHIIDCVDSIWERISYFRGFVDG